MMVRALFDYDSFQRNRNLLKRVCGNVPKLDSLEYLTVTFFQIDDEIRHDIVDMFLDPGVTLYEQ